jgi:hypothetical protein
LDAAATVNLNLTVLVIAAAAADKPEAPSNLKLRQPRTHWAKLNLIMAAGRSG